MTERPRTDDERWSQLLERMAVPNHPGTYVLGCFARHVTFHSQQVRALNLIDALCKTGTLVEGDTIGVIGAGLAGLTAAAAALQRGLRVHLFERGDDPGEPKGQMRLQINSDERWVDPFVYDWPHSVIYPDKKFSSKNPGTNAGLPILNWQAGTASAVRGAVLGSFAAVAQPAQAANNLSFHKCEVTEKMIGRGVKGDVSIAKGDGSPPIVSKVLVLALGFGVEDDRHTEYRYWTNDGLGGDQAEGKCYLVSGLGDGGLTDVMRLCIAEFHHRSVLDAFQGATDAASGLESQVRTGATNLIEVFLEAASKIVVPPSELAPRNTRVFLTGSPEQLFGPGANASILNRLIVAWLLREDRFRLVDARIKTPIQWKERRANVRFLDWDSGKQVANPTVWYFDSTRRELVSTAGSLLPSFDEVIVRHGPGVVRGAQRRQPFLENFPTYWQSSEENRDWWEKMPHWDDWTREPCWAEADFDDPPPPLDTTASCVVVEHAATGELVGRALGTALRRLPQLPSDLVSFDLKRDFANPHLFSRLVRALCRADIAVLDFSEKEGWPEALVLLGIRSVARRGITLVTARFTDTAHEPAASDAPFAVEPLPFLLQEIGVYGWGQEEEFTERLKRGIEEGQARATRLGSLYRDLPAYDEVRRLGPEPEDYRPQGPDEAILFLVPFNATYRKTKGSWLRSRVSAVAKGSRIYIAESPSPERTSSKLYSAIRRTQLCIVDWTDRRPNVFFELGVRLAVSSKPPVCVIHHDDKWAAAARKGRAGSLFQLFSPMVYDTAKKTEAAFEDMLRHQRNALERPDSSPYWLLNGARVSPDFVYRQVRAAVSARQEDWATPVWGELKRTAAMILGPKPDQYPDLPALFGDDQIFQREATQGALDRLLAAWYFLDRRYGIRSAIRKLAELNFEVDPWRSWLEIGQIVSSQLKYDTRKEYAAMRKEILVAIGRVKRRS